MQTLVDPLKRALQIRPNAIAFIDGERCQPCPIGAFKDFVGNDKCRECAVANTVTLREGAASPMACVTAAMAPMRPLRTAWRAAPTRAQRWLRRPPCARSVRHVLQLERLSDHFFGFADQLFAGTAIPRMPREIPGPGSGEHKMQNVGANSFASFAAMWASIAAGSSIAELLCAFLRADYTILANYTRPAFCGVNHGETPVRPPRSNAFPPKPPPKTAPDF